MQLGGGAPSPPPPPPSMGPHTSEDCAHANRSRWLTVTDAMAYLDAVKLEFRDQPDIYDEFLAIMGRFKTKEMLPPDVIVEVARLFRGRDSLVMRFNRFLPDGYKIGPADIQRMEEERVAQEEAQAQAQARERLKAGNSGPSVPEVGMRSSGRGPASGATAVGALSIQHADPDVGKGTTDNSDGEDDDDVHDPDRPEEFEFDHAINYVTCIKRRFAHEPETYKAFLDILHSYQRQREHTSINSVLEQVTNLFADQPDLLKEFTYFLPDTVQAQAKEKLDRAAEEAEIRLGMRGPHVRLQNGQRMSASRPPGGFEQAQGRSRVGAMKTSRGGPPRGRVHRAGPARLSQRDDSEQDWQDQRGYRPSGEGRGPHPGFGARASYSNGRVGGDVGRGGTRHPYPGRNEGPHGSVDMFRGGRRLDWMENRWRDQEVEEYDGGNDSQPGGPRKRARTAGFQGARGSGRSGPPTGPQDELRMSPEHRFFDQARHVLCAAGDSNDWVDLLKVLEMFSNEVFSREEMMVHVRDLFEEHNQLELLEEFQALVDRRGSLNKPPADSTPMMGLSELNLRDAMRCTPSYRELPKIYQHVRSSGRSEAEEKLLNDRWSSLPVGSEDTNTFKHMRRNPHEDVLFKVEDERFELDMLIDGVTAAIARLEPVEEEIEALKATTESASEHALDGFQHSREVNAAKPGSSSAWNGASPQFQYRLDERTLGAVHLSTVSRLYGEHGLEVLDLMRKNPAAAIPVVLKRLRQKEQEWRSAREVAKSGWKELAQKNFHRSLDHRSHHFRREDKRFTSNRALLQEIKDKKVEEDPQNAAVVKAARESAQDGQDDPVLLLGRISPASTAADADSLSAGQGSTGEADGPVEGVSTDATSRAQSPEVLPENGDTGTAARGGAAQHREGIKVLRQKAEETAPWYMFEHLTLCYPTEDLEDIHQDILELLSHTLARRPPSEEDVRQASSVVADLLPTFFAIQKPKRVANGADANVPSREVAGKVGKQTDPAQKSPSIPTLSSDEDRDSDGASVPANNDERANGQGRLARDAVGGSQKSCHSQDPGQHGDQGATGVVANNPGQVLGKESAVSLAPLPKQQELFFTTTDFYLALRMHHLLAERLAAAKRLCREAESSRQTVVACPQQVLQESAGVESTAAITGVVKGRSHSSGDAGEIAYKTFLGHLYDVLEEKINNDRYDEGVRQLVGNQGYVLCLLDRLVVSLLQNLYRASADKVFSKLTQLYHYERTTQTSGVVPATYRIDMEQLMRRSEKEVVRVQYHPGSARVGGSYVVTPTLKMEYIGRLDTGGGAQDGEENDGDGLRISESVVRAAVGGSNNSTPEVMAE